MVAYNIKYTLKSDPTRREILVEASNLMYAKKKIARKHGYNRKRWCRWIYVNNQL